MACSIWLFIKFQLINLDCILFTWVVALLHNSLHNCMLTATWRSILNPETNMDALLYPEIIMQTTSQSSTYTFNITRIYMCQKKHANCKNNMLYIYLTNRFHVAVRLFSNRSQMTSKCDKNKKVAHEAIAECVPDVLTTFWRLLWSITEQTHGNMESICFI